MKTIRIGMAVLNTKVGDMTGNADKILAAMEQMMDCTMGCFQEMTLCGYPPEDLVQWPAFEEKQWRELQRILSNSKDRQLAVFFIGLIVRHMDNVYNSVVVIQRGKILGLVPKFKLPTYNIFQEGRAQSKGIPMKTENFISSPYGNIPFGDMIFHFNFGTVGIPICESFFTQSGPAMRYAMSGADILLVPSSSPFRFGIQNTRRELIATRAAETQTTVVYVNQVGGNGSVIFDGGAFVNQNGKMVFEAPRFRPGVFTQVVDLDRTSRLRLENTTWRDDYFDYHSKEEPVKVIESSVFAPRSWHSYPFPESKSFFLPSDEKPKSQREIFFEEIEEICIMALSDYFLKTNAFKCLLISLSGGKDSVLTAVLAWLWAKRFFAKLPEAEQAEKVRTFVRCYSWPTEYNSDDTGNISKALTDALGLYFHEQSIQEEFELELSKLQESLLPREIITRLARQNIQARLRGERMANLSNCVDGMWIQTGNMSEKFAGYTTVMGDLGGAFSLISNLPKTVIIDFLGYLKKKHNLPLDEVINAVSSAELEKDQADEVDLLPFPIWDACMYLALEEKMSAEEIYGIIRENWTDEQLKEIWPGFESEMLEPKLKKLLTSFFRSIFKWVVSPEGAHMGKLDLDRERCCQIPVVQSPDWFFSK